MYQQVNKWSNVGLKLAIPLLSFSVAICFFISLSLFLGPHNVLVWLDRRLGQIGLESLLFHPRNHTYIVVTIKAWFRLHGCSKCQRLHTSLRDFHGMDIVYTVWLYLSKKFKHIRLMRGSQRCRDVPSVLCAAPIYVDSGANIHLSGTF